MAGGSFNGDRNYFLPWMHLSENDLPVENIGMLSPLPAEQTESQRRLVAGVTEFEPSFRQRFPVLWRSTFVGPFLVTIAALLTGGIDKGSDPGKRQCHRQL